MPGMMEERLLSEKYQGSGCDDFVSILPVTERPVVFTDIHPFNL
jgi:hypothetical protein